MPLRPCLGCGRLTPGTRCTQCARPVERAKLEAKRERRPRISQAEQQRRADAVARWRVVHGDWCPGWRRPGHRAADLTADHVVPVGAGGAEGGPLSVLCRGCNGAKGNRLTPIT